MWSLCLAEDNMMQQHPASEYGINGTFLESDAHFCCKPMAFFPVTTLQLNIIKTQHKDTNTCQHQ